MSIAVKTDTGWQVLGAGTSSGGGSSWGDWTIVDAPDEADTWTAPDSQGRIWKYVAFNTAGDFEINLSGGMYWVLAVGGGSAGHIDTESRLIQGQPGLVNEGYWEFGSGPISITVGEAGSGNGNPREPGKPSSIGDYGTQGVVTWGAYNTGRAALKDADKDGYRSDITGSVLQYAVGADAAARPGRSGYASTRSEQPGCVIIATVDEEKTDYYPPGALPGVGGWATITGIDGSAGTRYQYGDWVAYEFTADGSVTTTEGLADVLVSSGGGGWGSYYGHGGRLTVGVEKIGSGKHDVVIGKGGNNNNPQSHSEASSLGVIRCGPINADTLERHACGAGGANYDGNNKTCHPGVWSDITGTNLEYAAASVGTGWRENSGMGGRPTGNEGGNGKGANGVVICRVPKAHAYLGALPAGWVDA
jgi:hypothetical protein